MKTNIIIGIFLSFFLFSGCFEDKGNYKYIDLNAPQWTFNHTSSPIRITTYAGDTIRVKAPFYFAQDSNEMLARVRYEWKFRDVVLSEERDFYGIADTMVAHLGLSFSEMAGSNGTYTIFDTKSDIRHMVRTWVTIRPWIFQGDWLILSEKGNDSKLSFLKKKTRSINGVTTIKWSYFDNYYETVNGTPLLGRPRRLRYCQGRNISAPNGSTSIVTDKSVYTLNNENFKLHDELKDEFLDGTPPNFTISNVFHSRLLTLIATQDGRLFRRLLPDNWIGGKFITDPYVIDSKGYKITDFGTGMTAQGSNISPCYDELNRRVMMIRQNQPYSILPTKIFSGTNHPLPVWDMPEGTEILHLYLSRHKTLSASTTKLFTMIFNDAEGKTWMSDFVVNYDGIVLEHEHASLEPFPAGNLPKGTRFLTCSDSYMPQYVFYTNGKELRYVNLINKVDYHYLTFDHPLAVMRYAAYNVNYKQIMVALENGDFMLYDIADFDNPVLMEETKGNVGGKIVDVMELRLDTFYDAP